MNKERFSRQTGDGSPTIYSVRFGETYHSLHGAMKESLYVFIDKGLKEYASQARQRVIRIGEMGFGTGLNAFLAWRFAKENEHQIIYETYEMFPLNSDEYKLLNFYRDEAEKQIFLRIHISKWEQSVELDENFTLIKHRLPIEEVQVREQWDVIFFDAFSPRSQPELWTFEVLKNMYLAMRKNGVFVTYSAKGEVRRNLIKAGFKTERLAGPLGKRHMLRAWKK